MRGHKRPQGHGKSIRFPDEGASRPSAPGVDVWRSGRAPQCGFASFRRVLMPAPTVRQASFVAPRTTWRPTQCELAKAPRPDILAARVARGSSRNHMLPFCFCSGYSTGSSGARPRREYREADRRCLYSNEKLKCECECAGPGSQETAAPAWYVLRRTQTKTYVSIDDDKSAFQSSSDDVTTYGIPCRCGRP